MARDCDVARHKPLKCVGAKMATARTGEDRIVGFARLIAQPCFYHRDDVRSKRSASHLSAFAEATVSLTEVFAADAPVEPETDYVPDPDLDLMIADAEALRAALTEGPVLIAGNKLVN